MSRHHQLGRPLAALAVALLAIATVAPSAGATITVVETPITLPYSNPGNAYAFQVNDTGMALLPVSPPAVVTVRRADGSTFMLDDVDRSSFADGQTLAFDLSDGGFIVGSNNGSTVDTPWLFLPTEHRLPLATGAVTNGRALAVDGAGAAVGYVSTDRSLSDVIPVLWRSTDHALTPLPIPIGATGLATGINDAGMVTGVVGTDPVAWDLGQGTMTVLPGGPIPTTATVTINALGEIQTPFSDPHLLWPTGSGTPLVIDPATTAAVAVNDAGYLLQWLPQAGGDRTLVRWNTRTDERVTIATMPAGQQPHAQVNDLGQVVFRLTPGIPGVPGGERAELFDPQAGLVDLPDAYQVFDSQSFGNAGIVVFSQPTSFSTALTFLHFQQAAPSTTTTAPPATVTPTPATPSFTG
jgi:hypothetical protein